MVSSIEQTFLLVAAAILPTLGGATFLPAQRPADGLVTDVDRPSETVNRAND